jgi:hypothetical protein
MFCMKIHIFLQKYKSFGLCKKKVTFLMDKKTTFSWREKVAGLFLLSFK